MSKPKPCAACPWVPGRPLSDAIKQTHRDAASRGDWFCCHVNMGTCHGAANYAEREKTLEIDLPLDAPEKPNKGKEGGACNRRSCQAEPALWYNHGSYAWYCADCAHQIGDDHVNKRHWQLDFEPKCGHPQFETREQMNARALAAAKQLYDLAPLDVHPDDIAALKAAGMIV